MSREFDMPTEALEADPIFRVQVRLASELKGNAWNPNIVFNRELNSLERNILAVGWVQPILINPNDLIIDGFHRQRLAMESKALLAKYGGMVPVAVLDVDDAQARILTIRMNRAKGTHVAVRMQSIVKELIDDHQWSREQVAAEIGAPIEEIDTLYQDDVFSAKGTKDYRYSKAWVPVESRNEKAG